MAALLLLALALALTACTRDPEGQAAVRAQDACIAALEPVALGRVPSDSEIATASRHAEATADVDDRWLPLRARVRALSAEPAQPAVDALAEECRRVNDLVRSKLD